MLRRILPLLIPGVLVVASCSSDPTTSAEYQNLEQQLAGAEQQLADVTAERDALATQAASGPVAVDAEQSSVRRDKVRAHLDEIIALLDDPEAFGTEEEVADLIATHATPDALMDDEVFGAVNYRSGFYNTLYAGAMSARIDVHYSWVSDDGSQGVILWLWHGINAAGNPFELAGISLTTHDDEGLITYEFVTYPYLDEYVREAVIGEGT